VTEWSSSGSWPANAIDAASLSQEALFALLLEVEHSVRALVRRVFARDREDWTSLIPQSIRERLEDTKSSHLQPSYGPNRAGTDLLDFATIGDLESIVSGRWKYFDDILRPKTATLVRLSDFRLFRNAIAHGVALGEDDRVRAYLIARDLKSRLPMALLTDDRTQSRSVRADATPVVRGSSVSVSGLGHVRARWMRNAFDALAAVPDVAVQILEEPRRSSLPVALVRLHGVTRVRVVVGQTAFGFVPSRRSGRSAVQWCDNEADFRSRITDAIGVRLES
jgi:hypothetical protein